MKTIWPSPMPPPPGLVLPHIEICGLCDTPAQLGYDTCFGCMSPANKEDFITECVARTSGRALSRMAEASRNTPRARRQRRERGSGSLTLERKNGAKVLYPGCDVEIPTIWTPVKCYPYPTWRRKYHLKGSYLTSLCKVVFPGWKPGEKDKMTQGGV